MCCVCVYRISLHSVWVVCTEGLGVGDVAQCLSVARLGLLSSEWVECRGSPADTLAHHLNQLLSYSE